MIWCTWTTAATWGLGRRRQDYLLHLDSGAATTLFKAENNNAVLVITNEAAAESTFRSWNATANGDGTFQFGGYSTDIYLTMAAASIKNPVDNAGYYTGAGDDLRMYHDGSNSIIDNSTGQLVIDTAGNFLLRKRSGSEAMINAAVDGAVTLYYNNVAAIATSPYGAKIDWTAGATLHGSLSNGGLHIKGGDVASNTGGQISLWSSAYGTAADACSVQLFHNAVLKLKTTTNGIAFPTAPATGNQIHLGTTDGSDSGILQISGGGAAGNTRGAYINLFGNELQWGSGHLAASRW